MKDYTPLIDKLRQIIRTQDNAGRDTNHLCEAVSALVELTNTEKPPPQSHVRGTLTPQMIRDTASSTRNQEHVLVDLSLDTAPTEGPGL